MWPGSRCSLQSGGSEAVALHHTPSSELCKQSTMTSSPKPSETATCCLCPHLTVEKIEAAEASRSLSTSKWWIRGGKQVPRELACHRALAGCAPAAQESASKGGVYQPRAPCKHQELGDSSVGKTLTTEAEGLTSIPRLRQGDSQM